MDKSSWLRVTDALAESPVDVLQRPGWSKASVKIKSPRPGLWSGVDCNGGVENNVGVSVAGNQTIVSVGVSVSGIGEEVDVSSGDRLLQAVRKTSTRMPRNKEVSFIG
jgi:hypothetical protein